MKPTNGAMTIFQQKSSILDKNYIFLTGGARQKFGGNLVFVAVVVELQLKAAKVRIVPTQILNPPEGF